VRLGQRIKVGAAVLGVALVGVVVVPAGPAHAAVRNVAAGQSIQAAVNAASPGDTIKVASAVFREAVEVTKSLTILSEGAVLQPPATPPTQSAACQDPSAKSEISGFCVHGTFDAGGNLVTPVGAVRISGFSIKNFPVMGVIYLGANNPQADNNIFLNNGEYGVAAFESKNVRITGNIANKNGLSGVYVGDSPQSNAVIQGNQANNQSIGIFIRDADGASTANPAKISGNLVRGNCIGVLLLNTGGVPAHWEVNGNQSSANNAFCPQFPASGNGMAFAGADDVSVHDNLVTNNQPSQSPPQNLEAGIVVAENATNIRVTGNEVKRNLPVDLRWDGTGSATFTNNSCKTSQPNGLC
jgi:parallel beta-helix repeat protein